MTNVKKILAILLALCIVCGGTSVLAAGQTVTYTSPTSRYQAQKFSHPDAGVGEIDGIIEYDSGENDRGQNYSWSAQGYGDYMYVGTCYAAIYATINIMAKQSGVDVEVFKAGLNALYNGTLYMGDLENNPSDARFWFPVMESILTQSRATVLAIHTITAAAYLRLRMPGCALARQTPSMGRSFGGWRI